MRPLRRQHDTLRNKIQALVGENRKTMTEINNSIRISKDNSVLIEGIEDKIDNVEDKIGKMDDQMQDYEKDCRETEEAIERLEAELEDQQSQDTSLQIEEKDLMASLKQLAENRNDIQNKMESADHEYKALNNQLANHRRRMDEIKDVNNQKYRILATKLPNGADAHKGMQWLANNRDQFHGRIYNPMLINIDMHNSEEAFVLENLIPVRDLVAFGAEGSEGNSSSSEVSDGKRLI